MKTFIIIVSIIAAIAASLFVAPFAVPTGHYKNLVKGKLQKIFDGTIAMESFNFQILPYPAYTIRGLSISAKQTPAGNPDIRAAVVHGQILPKDLLRGRIMTDLTIKDLALNYYNALEKTSNIELLLSPFLSSHGKALPTSFKSVSLINGAVLVFKEGQSEPLQISRIEAKIDEIGFGPEVSAKVVLKAAVAGKETYNVALNGNFSVDIENQLFNAKQTDVAFAESRFSVDAAYKYSTKEFDVHFATPSVSVSSLSPVIPQIAGGLPLGVELNGPVALDAALNGTRDNFSLKCQIDATTSLVKLGTLFKKDANQPFKIIFSGAHDASHTAVDDVTFYFGTSALQFKGDIINQPGHPAHLTLVPGAFDANTLKNYFPFLAAADDIQNPAVSLDITGNLDAVEPPKIDVSPIMPQEIQTGLMLNGRFTAEKATFLTYEVVGLETDFQYANGQASLSTFKGAIYDGALSGNGTIDLKATPTYHFELVVDKVNSSKISSLPAIFSGQASLVVKADAQGSDSNAMKETLVLDGTFILPTGEILPLNVGSQILTETVWSSLESRVTGGLDPQTKQTLAGTGQAARDLKASFNSQKGLANIQMLEWAGADYQARAKGSIGVQGETSFDGSLYISKESAARLVKDPNIRKIITTRDGTIEIPFTASGTLLAMAVRPDEAKLAAGAGMTGTSPITEGSPTQGSPTQAIVPKEAPISAPQTATAPPPAEPKPQTIQQKKTSASSKPAKKPQSKPKTDNSSDDVMRVIIGQ